MVQSGSQDTTVRTAGADAPRAQRVGHDLLEIGEDIRGSRQTLAGVLGGSRSILQIRGFRRILAGWARQGCGALRESKSSKSSSLMVRTGSAVACCILLISPNGPRRRQNDSGREGRWHRNRTPGPCAGMWNRQRNRDVRPATRRETRHGLIPAVSVNIAQITGRSLTWRSGW